MDHVAFEGLTHLARHFRRRPGSLKRLATGFDADWDQRHERHRVFVDRNVLRLPAAAGRDANSERAGAHLPDRSVALAWRDFVWPVSDSYSRAGHVPRHLLWKGSAG